MSGSYSNPFSHDTAKSDFILSLLKTYHLFSIILKPLTRLPGLHARPVPFGLALPPALPAMSAVFHV